MSLTKSIGKNTLGGGKKMEVDLKTYNRSTHDLSYAWRNTQSVGTLVPFMCEIGLPADTWDIELNSEVLTHPTVGPLFGSFKWQLDIFTCPIRLYNSLLHNNALNIGLDMSKVKFPKFAVKVNSYGNGSEQIHKSALLSYLGRKGFGVTKSRTDVEMKFNATAAIAYYDIFKNYYANKQEENFKTISFATVNIQGNGQTPPLPPLVPVNGVWTTGWQVNYTSAENLNENEISDLNIQLDLTMKDDSVYNMTTKISELQTGKKIYPIRTQPYYITLYAEITDKTSTSFTIRFKYIGGRDDIKSITLLGSETKLLTIQDEPLKDIDTLREKILSNTTELVINGNADNLVIPNYIKKLVQTTKSGNYISYASENALHGICLKTYQSDIFNNWINTEWIDGENGINAITAIDTTAGNFTLDTLNLSKKVYDMLNRIAVSGGTYQDWIETVYTNNYIQREETPVYQGGMSDEIVFQEVISQSATEEEPLGSLAGRGKLQGKKKGGSLHIKINEPCYIIGICSITPRVDYCQGNRFDTDLDTLNDLHKPALDGIGFQDLTTDKMHWKGLEIDTNGVKKRKSVGKQPAWLDYMTNYNRTFGNFAIENNEAYMCLNRFYETAPNGDINVTSYIDPRKYNYIFADTSIDALNFWAQIGVGATVRRMISAKIIPNL